nr:GTPase ObgE [Anaerolineae bacterium]
MLDEVKIYVKGGDGGAGAVAFRREKYVPLGGPSGGDGGKGGDVLFVVDPRLSTLAAFQKRVHFKAESGKHGSSNNKTGASGSDHTVYLPPGSIVRDIDTGQVLADLVKPGQHFLAAQGGRGGRGNSRFKTSTNQAPRMAEKGELGQERWLLIELKLIADVGIVGVPNAGKSTLLSVISAARPKIAPYPFTTLEPNLGVAIVGDRELVFADIPGLVEGAHAGVGLGHSFLKHIQRTRLLIHLLDGASSNPMGDFVQISTELALYDESLGKRPQIVALNKIDLPQAQELWPEIKEEISGHGLPVVAISGATHQGIQDLLNLALESYDSLPEPEQEPTIPVFRPKEDEDLFQVTREGDVFRVTGKRIERAAAVTYWQYDEAVLRFQRILAALGITDALIAAGIRVGDTVLIGDYELEWAE